MTQPTHTATALSKMTRKKNSPQKKESETVLTATELQNWDSNSMSESQFKSTVIKGAGQEGGGVGSPTHLSPPTYLDNLQIILKTYKFNLRFKERTTGMLQREEFALLISTTLF